MRPDAASTLTACCLVLFVLISIFCVLLLLKVFWDAHATDQTDDARKSTHEKSQQVLLLFRCGGGAGGDAISGNLVINIRPEPGARVLFFMNQGGIPVTLLFCTGLGKTDQPHETQDVGV